MEGKIRITGTHFQYYHVCKRKLWLFANGITMEHVSDLVYEGKLVHAQSYPQRSARYEEVEIDGIKVDYYDPREQVIHEIKKSNKMEIAHEWQLKYYLLVFARNGMTGCSGLLEYPLLRRIKSVELEKGDEAYIVSIEKDIQVIVSSPVCPPKEKKRICLSCSYFDFCHSAEIEER